MKKIGVSLIIVSSVIWTLFFVIAIFSNQVLNEGYIISAIAIGLVGAIFVLIGVGKDRYHEYKEEQKNDDYRKY